jgi:hypothetical protein
MGMLRNSKGTVIYETNDDDDCNVEAAGAKPTCDDKAESLMFYFPFFSCQARAPLRDG